MNPPNPDNSSPEEKLLKGCWDQLPADHLDTYLVGSVEDPRINCQSILNRSLLASTLWPGEFDQLIHEELRFGVVMSWMVHHLAEGAQCDDLFRVLNEKDEKIPDLVQKSFNLEAGDDGSLPNYLSEILMANLGSPAGLLDNKGMFDLFQGIWRGVLAGREPMGKLVLVEPACGSANDYRFLDSYGFGRFIEYHGFDLSTKNIDNARSRFPDVDFRVASAFGSGLESGMADVIYVHDLFEHLSPDGVEKALEELLRLSRGELWLHFFNLTDIPEHEFNPVDDYHWNLLSLPRMMEWLEGKGLKVDVIDVDALLSYKFGYGSYHNKEAVTLVCTK